MEIVGSLIIAICQSILFYGKQIGISMIIFTLISTGIIWLILYKKNKVVNKAAVLFMIPIILLSSTYFIFANRVFYNINLLAIIVLTILMFIIATNKRKYFKEYIYNSLKVIPKTMKKIRISVKLTNRTLTKTTINIKGKTKINKESVKKIISSLFIVVIVVGVIIALLASADSIFSGIFTDFGNMFTNIKLENINCFISRLLIVIIIYFLTLSLILAFQKKEAISSRENKSIGKDKFTIKMLLIVLNVVYLVFCYIQVNSLFIKMNSAGTFNYAEYARSGFFQLMIVSFINFILILISNRNNETRDKLIKVLNLFLILFTIIIVLSSMYRMYMYETEYGFTYLRLFVYIILATELIVFIPTIIYVFNAKFDLLKWGTLIGICVYVSINFMNLENIIIDRNLKRQSSKVDTDYDYICHIASADSYNKLETLENNILAKIGTDLDNLNTLNDITKIDMYEDLVNILDSKITILNEVNELDWQEFNISQYNVIKKYDDISSEISKLNLIISKLDSSINRLRNTKNITMTKNYIYNEMVSYTEGYLVYEVDHAMGDAIWQIEKTTDSGENYNLISQIEVKTPSKIEFFENGLGFLMLPDSIYCGKSDLLITNDSGNTFKKIEFPDGVFTLSNPNGEKWENCYDYFYLPTRENDGTLVVLVSGGYEGGYNSGKTRAKYVSKDNGKTWKFVSEILK